MEKYTLDDLKLLTEWIKQKEIRADEKYWKEMGLDGQCPTSADLLFEEKNSIITKINTKANDLKMGEVQKGKYNG